MVRMGACARSVGCLRRICRTPRSAGIAYWLTFVSWLAVVVGSIVPNRRTLLPVLAAETVMLSAASLGHLGHWLTDGDRHWAYYAASVALVWFLVGDATRQ